MTKIVDSLDDYTKDELLAHAEEFGVEVRAHQTKAAIIAAFQQDGVTVELIKGFTAPVVEADEDEEIVETVEPTPAPVEDDDESLVLVKMIRKNASYEVRGYRFTREHPYGLVSEDNADYLIEEDGGFRMASPKEAREFYS